MNLPVKAIAILLLAAPSAFAQNEANTCVFNPDSPNSCIRFIGCIDKDGAYFYGKSIGWQSGTVTGHTSEGEQCSGVWKNNDNKRRGEGTLNCGTERATFKYFPRSKDFNVISGVAISSKGRQMITWAGEDLEGYLKVKFPDETQPGFQCGSTWITLPDPQISSPDQGTSGD